MEISFIIVNHRSKGYLEPCISSVADMCRSLSYEIIIVSTDNDALENLSPDRNITVLDLGKNTGFGKACNAGSRLARGKILCFLNPDTEILSPVAPLIDILTGASSTGAAGPRLVAAKESGIIQPWCAGTEQTPLEIIFNNLGFGRSSRIWQSASTCNADWISGAALFVRQEVFDTAGGFDENFFLYYEDVDLCLRIRKMGFEIKYFPTLEVLHWGGKSSVCSRNQKKHYFESQDRFIRKHYGLASYLAIKLLRLAFHFPKQ